VIAYLDSSVLMRIVLREPNPLEEWPLIITGVTSTLTRVEAARAMDREVLLGAATENALREKQREIADVLRRLEYVPLEDPVLAQAAQPLPVVLGTLDSIHLATAILYRAAQSPDERPLPFATHDFQLARAARAMNFEVLGA
jgi:predicted nucleic acid-binding protein